MPNPRPSLETHLELLESTGKAEVACLESILLGIVERYEKTRALNPRLFYTPLMDAVVVACVLLMDDTAKVEVTQ